MATIPPITVPVVADLIGGGLRCCPCTDNAITEGTPIADVPVAITLAPSVQQFTMPGQQIMAPIVLPVCIDCRRRQMGVVSKTGLLTA